MKYESLTELPDGTYLMKEDGSIVDYSERWSYGYIVATAPIEDPSELGSLFGVWTENGERYYDRVVHVDSLSNARELGALFNQKAIWDLRNEEAIYL